MASYAVCRALAGRRITARLGQLFLLAVAVSLGSLVASVYHQLHGRTGDLHRHKRFEGGVVEWELYDIGEADLEGSLGLKSEAVPRRTRTDASLVVEEAVRRHPKVSRVFVEQLLSHRLSCSSGREDVLQSTKYDGVLQALERYAAFHQKAKSVTGVRTLVWLCDAYHYCGGLADRLKGMAYALLLAMFSNRVLLISWGSTVHGEKDYLQPNVINWVLPDEKFEEYWVEEVFFYGAGEYAPFNTIVSDIQQYPNSSSLYFIHLGSILDGIGVDVSYEQLRASLYLIQGDSPDLLALSTNMEPRSLLNRTQTANQTWIAAGIEAVGLADLSLQDVDDIIGIIFQYLFQFTDDVMAEVAVAKQVLGLAIGSLSYTGVHVRTGFAGTSSQETVDHPKLIRQPKQWRRVLQCAVDSADEHVGKNSLIFLATDSPLVKHIALSVYGSRFRTLDNSLVHLDRMIKFPHYPYGNETEGTLTVLVELAILAQSYVQVCSPGSGFTMLSSQLCFLPRSRVVDGLQCLSQVL